ncbi:MAG: hypothetical protein ABI947_22935 [Chloroflexota bacterium]
MNDLLQTQAMLTALLQTNTALSLALAAAWLDPALLADDEDEDDECAYTLAICRRCFPDVYASAVHHLRSGVSRSEVDRVFCEGIGRYLVVDVQDIQQFQYGVPWEALGIDLYDQEAFQEASPRLAVVAAWFGVTAEDSTIEQARRVAEALIKSLEPYGETGIHSDVASLLRWLFGLSGNTLVDFTDEELYESGIEPVPWECDDIAFINDVQQEAYMMVDAATRALTLLETNADWREYFQQNTKLTRRNPKHAARLDWPADAGSGDPDATHADA